MNYPFNMVHRPPWPVNKPATTVQKPPRSPSTDMHRLYPNKNLLGGKVCSIYAFTVLLLHSSKSRCDLCLWSGILVTFQAETPFTPCCCFHKKLQAGVWCPSIALLGSHTLLLSSARPRPVYPSAWGRGAPPCPLTEIQIKERKRRKAAECPTQVSRQRKLSIHQSNY